jgi:hypothetical protein
MLYSKWCHHLARLSCNIKARNSLVMVRTRLALGQTDLGRLEATGRLLTYSIVSPSRRTITCIPPNSILFAFLHPPLSILDLKITAALPNDFPFPDPNFHFSPLFSHARSRPLSFICLSFICYFSLLLLPSLLSAVCCEILYFPFSHHQH